MNYVHITVRLPFKIHDSSQTKGYIIIFAYKVLGLPVEEDLFHFTASKYNGTVHRHKIFLQFGTILLHIGVTHPLKKGLDEIIYA